MTRSAPARLLVETREIDPVEDLLAYTDPSHPLVWQRRGDGMAGIGAPVTLVGGGHDETLGERWRAIAERAEIDDPLRIPGTGLVGFGALTFDRESSHASTIVVPGVVVGRRHGRSWITTARTADAPAPGPRAIGYGPHWSATLGPGSLSADGYMSAVRDGLAAIAASEVSKVVLARDLAGTVPAGADLRRLVRSLASGYPDTWAFAVDGLIGASPETLVTVEEGTVTARVLAGTAARGADPDADTAASLALATSTKDQDEHQFAVRSVLEALGAHTSALRASEQPFTLKLPNVWHLATDVEGRLSGAASALDLVAALHPTAAVAGTPTPRAIEVIRRLEPFDRGRYAGPVGWIDAAGSGEWAIALRCAQFDPGEAGEPIPLTAYAGAGIVAGSDPESELLETRVKFRPIVDALA
ncbi:isochorismate synthase MenF [Microbacterium sp. 18062]|uniref:isochorismate synthase n=1 Tax=Microbacterium sp. 18062 TaxID=2681410 RepID=UPI00190F3039|nr:isochorismate synthase [Microbacterium sp. 18062]